MAEKTGLHGVQAMVTVENVNLNWQMVVTSNGVVASSIDQDSGKSSLISLLNVSPDRRLSFV